MWPQINSRVNYPLKRVLYQLMEQNVISMTTLTEKFCVSFIVVNTAAIGMARFVSAWNSHFIAGII